MAAPRPALPPLPGGARCLKTTTGAALTCQHVSLARKTSAVLLSCRGEENYQLNRALNRLAAQKHAGRAAGGSNRKRGRQGRREGAGEAYPPVLLPTQAMFVACGAQRIKDGYIPGYSTQQRREECSYADAGCTWREPPTVHRMQPAMGAEQRPAACKAGPHFRKPRTQQPARPAGARRPGRTRAGPGGELVRAKQDTKQHKVQCSSNRI